MNKWIKFIFYIEVIIILQLLFLIFPILIAPDRLYLVAMFMPINAVGCLYSIKNIEKMYYKKYNKWSSMLYMVCPLIGMILIYLFSLLIKLDGLKVISIYYVLLFIIVYLFNFIYVLRKTSKK